MSEEFNPEENPYEDWYDLEEKVYQDGFEEGIKYGQKTFLQKAINYIKTEGRLDAEDLVKYLQELLVIKL